ncbi:MAG TPA: CBS domain-containing protein [Casimicrobiaceae bacterium]|nr:CBS domain-containing protein [Casimicrobiaceae bacterium]
MNEQRFHSREAPDPVSEGKESDLHDPAAKDHFLKLMFFQATRHPTDEHPHPHDEHPPAGYAPLRHSTAQRGQSYSLALSSGAPPVRLDSPALAVMTDLRQTGAVTILGRATLDLANQTMIRRGVRALFVVDEARHVLGIVTATDLLGERPMQVAHNLGIRHNEVVVRDIMTPGERLEVLDIRDVEAARVGDIIATLRLAGRQHALAIEQSQGVPQERVICGIFSVTQIARQLGIPPQQDIARTFAEIEAAIAG